MPLFSSQPTWVADRPLIDIIIPNVSKYSRRQIMNPFSAAAGELIYLSPARPWHLLLFFLFSFLFFWPAEVAFNLVRDVDVHFFFFFAFFSLGILIPSECDFRREGGRTGERELRQW